MFLEDIEGSPSLEMINLVLKKIAAGEKVLSLAIGEPSFQTPKEIIERAYKSMVEGNTHYVSAYGTPEFREAARRKVKRKNGINAQAGNTIFSTTKFSVYASLVAVSNTSYDALLPDPGYFYSEPATLSGGRPIYYRLNEDFSLNMEEIRKKVTKRTKAIIINSPANPTGKVFRKNEIRELYDFCHERGIYLISDEAYEDLVYGVEHFSAGSLEPKPEIVISLYSLSKSYSMTGWRAGYVVAGERIIYLINKFFENTLTCFPPFIQSASAYALEKCDRHIRLFRDELAQRKKLMEEKIAGIDALVPNRIEGAFYAFPRYKGKMTSSEAGARILDKHGVAVLPGTSFGPSGEKHLRISFSGSRESIDEGMNKVGTFFREARSH